MHLAVLCGCCFSHLLPLHCFCTLPWTPASSFARKTPVLPSSCASNRFVAGCSSCEYGSRSLLPPPSSLTRTRMPKRFSFTQAAGRRPLAAGRRSCRLQVFQGVLDRHPVHPAAHIRGLDPTFQVVILWPKPASRDPSPVAGCLWPVICICCRSD